MAVGSGRAEPVCHVQAAAQQPDALAADVGGHYWASAAVEAEQGHTAGRASVAELVRADEHGQAEGAEGVNSRYAAPADLGVGADTGAATWTGVGGSTRDAAGTAGAGAEDVGRTSLAGAAGLADAEDDADTVGAVGTARDSAGMAGTGEVSVSAGDLAGTCAVMAHEGGAAVMTGVKGFRARTDHMGCVEGEVGDGAASVVAGRQLGAHTVAEQGYAEVVWIYAHAVLPPGMH